MSLESAQSQFLDLMRSLPNANTQKLFGDWIKRVVLPELEQQVEVEQNIVSARIRLNQISSYLSSVVPVEAVLPSEQIQFPSQGNKHTKHDTRTVNQRKKGTIFRRGRRPQRPQQRSCGRIPLRRGRGRSTGPTRSAQPSLLQAMRIQKHGILAFVALTETQPASTPF